ncbi:hypothetical protein [Flavobacterium sp. NKUCC04_CG]|uniref:hypothetical protein n=1 Tax=Flavobacterium sp. NKUCC04_CG TaxID=2842121 RepID=UPI001C5ABC50|nr:hypothetical protein [Flavobacterium sp. NKUCC04_CG]MBW3519535.1 hypothetical protein [Flavobacterium sp. NKUCC04_CG]
MTKVLKKNARQNSHLQKSIGIDIHIKKAFEIIEEFLPDNYVHLVQNKVSFSPGTIRNVKFKKKGNVIIINALLEVSLENMEAIEKLKCLTNKGDIQ